jgi:hypothetical protein
MVVALAVGLLGCGGGDEGSVAQRACARLDECNALAAGRSIDECTTSVQHDLDGLAPSARHDTEKILNDCLEFETCSTYLSCIGVDAPGAPPADDPPPSTPPPQSQTGQFTFTWSIERAGAPVTCADVGAATVRLHSVSNGGVELEDIFDCSSFRGTTGDLDVGTYTAFFTIHDANDVEMGRSQSQTATIVAGQVVPIQGVIWQVN